MSCGLGLVTAEAVSQLPASYSYRPNMRVSAVLRAVVAAVALLAVSFSDAVEGSGVSGYRERENWGGGAWEQKFLHR